MRTRYLALTDEYVAALPTPTALLSSDDEVESASDGRPSDSSSSDDEYADDGEYARSSRNGGGAAQSARAGDDTGMEQRALSRHRRSGGGGGRGGGVADMQAIGSYFTCHSKRRLTGAASSNATLSKLGGLAHSAQVKQCCTWSAWL